MKRRENYAFQISPDTLKLASDRPVRQNVRQDLGVGQRIITKRYFRVYFPKNFYDLLIF